MLFNPETFRRLTFLETEEGDGTEAKRSRSFSRALLVLLFAIEQATGASRKKNSFTYSADMKTCHLCESKRPQAPSGQGPGSDRVFQMKPHPTFPQGLWSRLQIAVRGQQELRPEGHISTSAEWLFPPIYCKDKVCRNHVQREMVWKLEPW